MLKSGSQRLCQALAAGVVRRLFYLGAAALALSLATSSSTLARELPHRVVSINVCTDQLAMLLAAPGQLVSVSHLAADPDSSVLVEEAASYRLNHGLAEEVFLMEPDLVLAGTFTTAATVSMLERLGFRIERFALETSFDDVRDNILRMGMLLGQQERAKEMVADLDDGLRQLAERAVPGLTAASYASNSYTTGQGSLSAAVIEAAGLTNLGSKLGIQGGGRLALEVLVLAMPEILTSDTPVYDAPALSQENFVHPAYKALLERAKTASVPSPNWICGGPFNLAAAAILQDAARATVAGQRAH